MTPPAPGSAPKKMPMMLERARFTQRRIVEPMARQDARTSSTRDLSSSPPFSTCMNISDRANRPTTIATMWNPPSICGRSKVKR